MERIPRHEINEFKSILEETLSKNQFSLQFEIVGSYRRGAETSGDIDVILTTTSPEQSSQIQSNTFKKFLDVLSKMEQLPISCLKALLKVLLLAR